jgi:cobalt/nickel transport system permease protein
LLFAMHIPDGFLSGGVAGALAVVAVAVVLWALRVADRNLTEAQVPLLGVVSAFVFAAQMLNFPIAGGTSGHFLGATLAAVLLGPAAACLVMAVVISIQALAFADGGISALGANVFNMGILGALIAGFLLAAAVRAMRPERPTYLAMVGVFSWVAVMVGALATSLELSISGTIPLGTVLPAMLGVHALIGVGESVITVAAVSAVLASRPDLVRIAPPEPAAAEPGQAAEVTA